MARTAAIPGIGPVAAGEMTHHEARLTAAAAIQPGEQPLFRRFRDTTAGWLQLPAASPYLPAPILAPPAAVMTGGDILAAHTVRRRHWWEF